MRKALAAAVAAIVLILAPSALAFGGKQLSSSACGPGKLVVNVKEKVLTDADSGTAGNVWAFDNYSRKIKVWQTGTNTFCAITRYKGQFTTLAGPSPQAKTSGGTVRADVRGTFNGGYRSTQFTGTLNPSPVYRTRGNIGVFDYNCDASFNCPGYVDWTAVYFTSTSGFDLAWWGWQYHAGSHGSWINSIDGNSGDITG